MQHFSPTLLSRAKYSPSLDGRVRLALREKQLSSQIRLATIVISAITILLNLYLLGLPPTESLNASQNDIIKGGVSLDDVSAKNTLLSYVSKNKQDSASIMEFFDITSSDIKKGDLVNLCVNCSNNSDKAVLGREPRADSNKLSINGGTYYYQKLADSFPGKSSLRALKTGDKYILMNSGNVVFKPDNNLRVDQKLIDNLGLSTKSLELENLDSAQITKRVTLTNTSISALNSVSLELSEGGNNVTLENSTMKPETTESSGKSISLSWTRLEPGKSVELIYSYRPLREKSRWCSKLTTSALELSRSESTDCLVASFSNSATVLFSQSNSEKNIAKKVSVKSLDGNEITEAKLDQEIVYEISLTNQNDEDIKDFRPEDFDMADILEYSNISDIQGGNLTNDAISWDAIDIKGGHTAYLSVTTKIFHKAPSTNQPESNPLSFDCVMSATYGLTVANVSLPCSAYKRVEQKTFKSNSIGPLAALLMIAAIAGASICLYYFDIMDIHHLGKIRSGENE